MPAISITDTLEFVIDTQIEPDELTIRLMQGFDNNNEPIGDVARLVCDANTAVCSHTQTSSGIDYSVSVPPEAVFAIVELLYASPGIGDDAAPFNMSTYAFWLRR